MNNEEYDELIKNVIENENITKNIIIAFLSGGTLGLVGQIVCNIFNKLLNFSLNDSYLLTFSFFVLIGSILTGIGIFDKILSIFKCGFIVPSTGFANTMTSSAMDSNREGFVKGVGSNIFKLTGSIILYGVIFGIIFGYIRSLL